MWWEIELLCVDYNYAVIYSDIDTERGSTSSHQQTNNCYTHGNLLWQQRLQVNRACRQLKNLQSLIQNKSRQDSFYFSRKFWPPVKHGWKTIQLRASKSANCVGLQWSRAALYTHYAYCVSSRKCNVANLWQVEGELSLLAWERGKKNLNGSKLLSLTLMSANSSVKLMLRAVHYEHLLTKSDDPESGLQISATAFSLVVSDG